MNESHGDLQHLPNLHVNALMIPVNPQSDIIKIKLETYNALKGEAYSDSDGAVLLRHYFTRGAPLKPSRHRQPYGLQKRLRMRADGSRSGYA